MAHEKAGRSAKTIQRWLGHSDLETTMAYLAGSDDDKQEVRKSLEDAFSFAA